jgi:hypothetical protein
VEPAAAGHFDIGQDRPDEVFETGIPRSAYRRGCLLKLIGTFLPKIGDQGNPPPRKMNILSSEGGTRIPR